MAGSLPKVVVFGAGLVGCYVGARLAPHARVTLIGRERIVELAREGLRVSDIEGFDCIISPEQVEATTDPAALAQADLVVVAVKSLATEEAACAIAAHAPADAPVLSLQNGVSNPEILRALLPGRTVLAGMVPFNVAEPEPGRFHRGTGVGDLVVEDSPALEPFLPGFAASGVSLRPSANMEGVQWGKLLVNLNNAVNAVSGVSLMEQLRQRGYRQAWAMAIREGLALLRKAGVKPVDSLPMPTELLPAIMSLPDRLYFWVVAQAGGGRARVDPHARSSMADDLAKGRPTEVDFLNGEIVRLAEKLGRTAPINARMVELVRAAERGAPPLSAEALLEALRSARPS
ncbi:MAG: 2-dehydropantoate 2-reductase [Sphingomonadaceae bacterium]